jgi:hypothetical protein
MDREAKSGSATLAAVLKVGERATNRVSPRILEYGYTPGRLSKRHNRPHEGESHVRHMQHSK